MWPRDQGDGFYTKSASSCNGPASGAFPSGRWRPLRPVPLSTWSKRHRRSHTFIRQFDRRLSWKNSFVVTAFQDILSVAANLFCNVFEGLSFADRVIFNGRADHSARVGNEVMSDSEFLARAESVRRRRLREYWLPGESVSPFSHERCLRGSHPGVRPGREYRTATRRWRRELRNWYWPKRRKTHRHHRNHHPVISPSQNRRKSRGGRVSRNAVASRDISGICGKTCHLNASMKRLTKKSLTKTSSDSD